VIKKINIPNMDYDSVFQMPCGDFQKNCRDLAALAEFVEIHSNGDIFTMSVTGSFAEQIIKIGAENENSVGNGDDENMIFIGRYNLKYLNLFCKASGLCPTIEIYIKEGYPIILTYSVASLGDIRFLLSPMTKEPE